MRAPALAPFPERPATERGRREGRHAALRQRRRAVTEDSAFCAFMFAGDLFAEPRARKLAKHHSTPRNRDCRIDAPRAANVPTRLSTIPLRSVIPASW
jgi:hypothetical protein